MLHYHVWFNLKAHVEEASGLDTVSGFIAEVCRAGDATGFQLLKNTGAPPRSKLPLYHALIEFADGDALGTAMKRQAQRGIHTGSHGRMLEVVCDFQIEVFTTLTRPETVEALQACEI